MSGTVDTTILLPSILVRPEYILIGINSGNNFKWIGIESVSFKDTDPWEHIEIPTGQMKHQSIHSPHIMGEIICKDNSSMRVALFFTKINGSLTYSGNVTNDGAVGGYAVEYATNLKFPVSFFTVYFKDAYNNESNYALSGFRVQTIELVQLEIGKETAFKIKFSADLIGW